MQAGNAIWTTRCVCFILCFYSAVFTHYACVKLCTLYSLQAMKLKRKLSLEVVLLIKRTFACCTSNGLLIIPLIDRKHLKCTSFKMFVWFKSTQPRLRQNQLLVYQFWHRDANFYFPLLPSVIY